MALREQIKWRLFPGGNLHARLRYRRLPAFFGGAGAVLDAGCGNGMLSYASFRKGNRVLGLSIKEGEVARCRRLFNEHLGIPPERLKFEVRNLYDIESLGASFDEIICSEVLEHIEKDREMCEKFWKLLKPGGCLHLCCPNADHPDNARQDLDADERGGHVRPGYTMDSYRALLDPIGFRITDQLGIGGPVRQFFNRRIIQAQQRKQTAYAVLLVVLGMALAWLDPRHPRTPYSLYVRARKPA